MSEKKIEFNKPDLEKSKKEYPERMKRINEGETALEKSMVVSEKALDMRIRV